MSAPEKIPKKILCDACKTAEAEYACSGCMKAFYCSEKCRRRDWRAHRQACPRPALRIEMDVGGGDDDVEGRHPNVLLLESAAAAPSVLLEPEYYNPLEEDLEIAEYTRDQYTALHTGRIPTVRLPEEPRRERRKLVSGLLPQKRPRTQKEAPQPAPARVPEPEPAPVPAFALETVLTQPLFELPPLRPVAPLAESGGGDWETVVIQEEGVVPQPQPEVIAPQPRPQPQPQPEVVAPQPPPQPVIVARQPISFHIRMRPTSAHGQDPFQAQREGQTCC